MNTRFSGLIPSHHHRRRPHRIVPALLLLTTHLPLLVLLLLLLLFTGTTTAYTELPDAFLSSISSSSSSPGDGGLLDDLDAATGRLLAPILIPRVPGTAGQARAQEHFVRFFRDELPRWDVSWYNSTSTTPATGARQLPFANLLFRRDPPAARGRPGTAAYLTLVAHYDSKFKPDGFIGATDSAAPCAMLMHVARAVEEHLVRLWGEGEGEGEGKEHKERDEEVPRWRRDNDNDDDDDMLQPGGHVGIQILLLDGEEAFETWTDTDSLYGARALAEEWENTSNPVLSTYRSPLGQIGLFVLLDLLGAPDPSVPSYFQTTHWAYRALAGAEARMRALGLLESAPRRGAFLPQADKAAGTFGRAGVQDDHLPFMHRGVPILHVIPTPFPRVWHTLDDDAAHLDPPTVRDWARIVTAFALEWLDVPAPPLPPPSAPRERGDAGGVEDGPS